MQRLIIVISIMLLALGLSPAAGAGPDVDTWNIANATFGQFRDGGRYYRIYAAQVVQEDRSMETFVFIGRGRCDVRYEDGVKMTYCKAPMELHYIPDDDLVFEPAAAAAVLDTRIAYKKHHVEWVATHDLSDMHVWPDYHASSEYGADVWLEFYRYADVTSKRLYNRSTKGMRRSGYVSTARAAAEDPTVLMENVRRRSDGSLVAFTRSIACDRRC